MVRISRIASSGNGSIFTLKQLAIYAVLSMVWYNIGMHSKSSSMTSSSSLSSSSVVPSKSTEAAIESIVQQKQQEDQTKQLMQMNQKIQALQLHYDKSKADYEKCTTDMKMKEQKFESKLNDIQAKTAASNNNISSFSSSNNNDNSKLSPRFSKHSIMAGMSIASQKDFVEKYDFGSPIDSNYNKNDVTIFYNENSIPTGLSTEQTNNIVQNTKTIQQLTVEEATNNCQIMHVATIPANERGKQSCLAVVENYNNQILQKWMREHNKLSDDLVYVNRAQNDSSRVNVPPSKNHIEKHWIMLRDYLNNVDTVIKELRPIAEKVAVDNTIIVMTCNMGQSELLMNFVCNAKAKGLDLDNVLVFPTDIETKELAEGLGLTTFYDEKNFDRLPKGEAKGYGDRNFVAMMFAKVVCVQLINHMGYDLLFQDVDVVWYRNPLEYFHDTTNPYHNFDMYFQDDGAHSPRYAPYSANSGFYYVRSNDKTRYLFTSLLYSGDRIIQTSSHQHALIQLLADHSSSFGLKVKVLSRDMKEFPGGYHYHRRKNLMKDIVTDKVVPEMFHMSWTANKKNKVKYFQQFGEWYVADKCIATTKNDIMGKSEHIDEDGSGDPNIIKKSLFDQCCLVEPNIVCHYRDKPSKIPCKESDPIDKGRPSFW